MRIGPQDCQNLHRALGLEWLETDGLGGFSSGTVAGANTRRYHALLLIAAHANSNRYVLVNHVEEWLKIGGEEYSLSMNVYPGAVHPAGYRDCRSFSSTPWPTWLFRYQSTICRREIISIHGRGLIILRWTLMGSPNQTATLRVRPMLTGRDYHALHHENGQLSAAFLVPSSGQVTWHPYAGLPPVHSLYTGTYCHAPDWYRHVQFPLEQERGLEYEEDWWSPGEFLFELSVGKEHTLALTSDIINTPDVIALISGERTRRMQLQATAPATDSFVETCRLASERFLVQRETRQTVIAGYPWFTDWGRDTFISLPGLCLVTGRYETAWRIIESFSGHVSEGMIPNRFPDSGSDPEYNTIDASLWFIYAVDRYLAHSNDLPRVQAVAWPAIKQILDGYRAGTRYDIHMDLDGLITGGTPGTQLTWMDAKVGDWVVTPRHGKPVEVQALWIKALEIGAQFATQFMEPAYAKRCRQDRARALESFRTRFWYEDGQYLYDTIDGPAGSDTSIRPNQMYAISLCDDLVTRDQAICVLKIVTENLLTPVGLRTLSPHDAKYCSRYEGSPMERDRAYHQGTVWPFLFGPFITSWMKTFGRTPENQKVAQSFLKGLEEHVQEACIGQVSEIFDGDAPHHPRGCPAQAWSVAEPLRAMVEDLGMSIPQASTKSIQT